MAQLASEHVAKSQQKQNRYCDKGAKSRRFKVEDQVLVLLSTAVSCNRLNMKKLGVVDYEIEMPGMRQERKIYHVNLMKSDML